MYKSIRIERFRCIEDLKMEKLGRINLIAGKNNAGKTAILEALFLHSGTSIPELAMRINKFRGMDITKVKLYEWGESPWDSIFHDFNTGQSIVITGEDDVSYAREFKLDVVTEPSEIQTILRNNNIELEGSTTAATSVSTPYVRILRCQYSCNSKKGTSYIIVTMKGLHFDAIAPYLPFESFFLPSRSRFPAQEEAERYRLFQMEGQTGRIVEILRNVEPRIRRLEMVVNDQPVLHADIGEKRLMPLPLMGDGLSRLCSIVLCMGNARKGAVLIDEFENGLHYSVQAGIWRAIAEAAMKFDTQVFATTHSLNCIRAAYEAMKDNPDFLYHRLDRVNGRACAVTYDLDTLGAAIDNEFEVR